MKKEQVTNMEQGQERRIRGTRSKLRKEEQRGRRK